MGTRISLLTVAVALIASCREPARPPAAAAPPVTIIRLDDEELARVTLADLATRRPLAALVSGGLATPAALDARTADGRRMTVPELARTYPDHDLALYLDAGRPALGLYRRSRPDQPAHVRRALDTPELALVGVTEIDLRSTPAVPSHDAGPADDRGLVVIVDGRPVEIAGARLTALDQHSAGPPGHQHAGWRLGDVLALAGVRTWTQVTLHGREGERGVERAQLEAPGVTALVRRNRRGQLRVAAGAAGANDVVDLHEVIRVEVDTGPR